MKAEKMTTVTLTMTEREAQEIAWAIPEALGGLAELRWEGMPFNWRSDPTVLKKLYNVLRPEGWEDLK